jgi:hypothetical protein
MHKVQHSFAWCKEQLGRWITNRRIRDPLGLS